jgi:hypothetical protein
MIDEPGLWYSVRWLILWVTFSVHVKMNAIASFVLSEFSPKLLIFQSICDDISTLFMDG